MIKQSAHDGEIPLLRRASERQRFVIAAGSAPAVYGQVRSVSDKIVDSASVIRGDGAKERGL